MKNSKRIIRWLLTAVLLGVFAFCTWQAVQGMLAYRVGQQAYSQLNQYVQPAVPEQTGQEQPQQPVLQFPQVDHAQLQQLNNDYVGWLYQPDTGISYPIAHTDNNDFYLNHGFEKGYDISGCLFLDSANNGLWTDRNNVVYGHHMRNGTMLASITNYRQQDYYGQHPYMMLLTQQQDYVIELFAGYTVGGERNTEGVDSWTTHFESDEAFAAWLQDTTERSVFKADVTPAAQDTIIALSTCTYEISNGRFVLYGILRSREEWEQRTGMLTEAVAQEAASEAQAGSAAASASAAASPAA